MFIEHCFHCHYSVLQKNIMKTRIQVSTRAVDNQLSKQRHLLVESALEEGPKAGTAAENGWGTLCEYTDVHHQHLSFSSKQETTNPIVYLETCS